VKIRVIRTICVIRGSLFGLRTRLALRLGASFPGRQGFERMVLMCQIFLTGAIGSICPRVSQKRRNKLSFDNTPECVC
jgi:hypothetical protein